jgi:hypothetical protein
MRTAGLAPVPAELRAGEGDIHNPVNEYNRDFATTVLLRSLDSLLGRDRFSRGVNVAGTLAIWELPMRCPRVRQVTAILPE